MWEFFFFFNKIIWKRVFAQAIVKTLDHNMEKKKLSQPTDKSI